MDKIITGLLLTILLAICGFNIHIWIKRYKENNSDIKPGQVWEYRGNDNPFESPLVCTNTVLDVKDGYVKNQKSCIKDANGPIEYITSDSIRWFLIGSKLIKESK